jgi:hypothetical protein
MRARSELATQSKSETAIDREFWIIVVFCTIGFAATIYLFDHFPFLLSSSTIWG